MLRSLKSFDRYQLVTPNCFCYQVYEEQVMGIICYRDERGEIVCEGYDAGPRYSHHSSSRNGERTCERYKERPRYSYPSPESITKISCEEYDQDEVKGISCYRDRTGEIICEGCDEGPRYSHCSSSVLTNSKKPLS